MFVTIAGESMNFYNREPEIKVLKETQKQSLKKSKMTFIVGRRRIGKTKLILHTFPNNKDLLYLFVSRKTERLLCDEYQTQIETSLNQPVIGDLTQFAQVFEYLMQYAINNPITVAIDEFQDFFMVNPSIYSQMQNIWDRYKDKSKMNLILSGSIYSLMIKIFEHHKEPLYGRADKKIILKPFNVDTLEMIIKENNKKKSYLNEDLLAFYILTGGVAKYVELFADQAAFSLNKMLNYMFSEGSTFIAEGKDILIEEFGREYTTYFSILSLISQSKTSRSQIESILEQNIGGYLDNLEKKFNLIKPVKPIFAKPGSRTQKYLIQDNFLNFWFRFIYKNQSMIEIENYDLIKEIIKRDFSTYSGHYLEKYFIEKFKLSGKFSQIGTYWEKGNQNEIDIVAINEVEKIAVLVEVKLNPKRIKINELQLKSQTLITKLSGYDIRYLGLSIHDLGKDYSHYDT